MSNSTDFGFAKLVPGFDFLQNLAKGASQGLPQMPTLSNWVAPTLNIEELEKRIGELKAVHFWLDQNSKALGATIQALEVQKMTLATLQGMNFSMGELATALKLKPDAPAPGEGPKAGEAASAADSAPSGAAQPARRKAGKPQGRAGSGGAGPVDPLQWWGSLTQQFQEIAANAMQDVAHKNAADTAVKADAAPPRPPAPAKKAARKASARKGRAARS